MYKNHSEWHAELILLGKIMNKPDSIMLSVLPIIPSRISLFYSHAITYYSCYIP